MLIEGSRSQDLLIQRSTCHDMLTERSHSQDLPSEKFQDLLIERSNAFAPKWKMLCITAALPGCGSSPGSEAAEAHEST